MLKLEGKMMSGSYSLGIKGRRYEQVLKLSVHSWDDTYALDIRHSSIMVSAPVISHFKTFSRLKT